MAKSWKDAADKFKQNQAKPPPGCQTLSEIAEEMEVSNERAKEVINDLCQQGRAERVRGKQLSTLGTLVPTTYYRLIKRAKSEM